MVQLSHLSHPEVCHLVCSLWKMTVSRRQRLPKASQYQKARTTTPRILRPRARACAVVAKRGGAEVSAVVASQCRSSVVALSTLGAFVLLAQVQEREELVLDLKS